MNKRYDVIALGELLIDFTENGVSTQGNPLLEANPGGAPCNVLAMLRKLGRSGAFVGKVGDDMFGRMLREELLRAGICADYLRMDASVHTTLAFVHKKPDGDRDFSFYRNPGADMMIRKDMVLTLTPEVKRGESEEEPLVLTLSDAVSVNCPSFTSKRKPSRIGMEFLLIMTLESVVNLLLRVLLDRVNLIGI